VNGLDLLLLALVALAALSGFRRGALLQIITYAGLLVGLLVGAVVAPHVARLADDPFLQSAVALGTFLAIAGLGDAIGWFVGARAWAAARGTRFQPLDSAGGSFVAVGALLLASWFVALNLAHGPFPAVSRQVQGSAIVRGLDSVLPEPPSVVGGVREFLDRFGFPDVFAGLPQTPAGPVEPPTDAQARRAFDAAHQSTMKIVGRACDRIQEGSGFLIHPNYVVTNAHVVAGVAEPQVVDLDGDAYTAVTVLFNPNLDLAVLRVEASPGPGLEFASDEVDRGAKGAAVGYPQGEGLTGLPAAVLRTLSARGLDIYSEHTVVRDVHELQTQVQPGNSGGPFVLVSGEVAGVVFAASTGDPGVGYALTASQVEPIVTKAVDRTREISTGPCTR
jgi:S1-C subfamily serine protease